MKTHEDLDVWQGSIDIVVEVYKVTEILIEKKKFELVKQIDDLQYPFRQI